MASNLTPTALRDLEEIPVSWTRSILSDVAHIYDCPHSTPKLASSGAYLVRTQDVRSGTLRLDQLARVSNETYLDRTRRAVPTEGDLLYSREGTYFGVAAEVPPRVPICLGQRMVHLRPKSQLDYRYLKHWLNSPLMARHITGLRDGSVAERLNMSTIRALPVAFPAVDEQRRMADLLGAFDDRFELLRQANTTLEAIAKALFKSWFVDFDPVRAKAEGREPEGMDAATAALFPSEFEDSELGSIPKGWETGRFDQEFDFTMGQSPPGSTYNEAGVGVAFFQGSTDFSDVYPSERVFCTQPTRFAQAGDLLMSVRAPVGALNVASVDCSIGRGLCAIRHNSGSTGFTYHSVQTYLERIENAAGEGALFRSLSKKQLAELPVLVADSSVVDAMISILEPLTSRRIASARQVERIVELRNTLLPRLMSGKLRLPEAEREIEAATV